MLEKPPPTGVVTGPFSPKPVRSTDSISSLGMYSWYFSKASVPAANVSQSIFTPEASRMRTVAPVTSGPMPSPGINVTRCAINSLWLFCAGLRPGRFLLVFFRVDQALQLGMELADVLEVPVDGGKTNIRDLVGLLEPRHDLLAQFGGGALALRRIHHKLLYLVHDLFHGGHRDRPFFTRPQHPGKDFLPLELLPAAVLFHYHVRDFVDALIGGKPFLAFQAFTAAPNRRAFLALARVNYFVILEPAKWAFHGCYRTVRSKFDCTKGGSEIESSGHRDIGSSEKPDVILKPRGNSK